MSNEFQWRNEMRKLGGPVEPERDLWPTIAQRLAAACVEMPASSRHRHVRWMAIAATTMVAVGAATMVYRWQRQPVAAPSPVAQEAPGAVGNAPASATASTDLPRTALEWAVPSDPQLAATAQNLDNASAQLQEALEQRPDAVFLVGLLNRTNAQRLRLMRKSPHYAR